MTERIEIEDIDLIYLSYDEPNAEQNWAQISEVAPWAKRVHGVKGFDAAHKACADLSETDRFVTIDGDNTLDPRFLDLALELPDRYVGSVLSWSGYNVINGLCYGNGGVKCWTKDFVYGMKSHEAAVEDTETVDFCWDEKYVQMDGTYSRTRINGTPYQAFRGGFREGVKLCMDRGKRIPAEDFQKRVWIGNQHRLAIWISVGLDQPNGIFSMLGAAEGAKYMMDPLWDHDLISDFDWFADLWRGMEEEYPENCGPDGLVGSVVRMCRELRATTGLKAYPMKDPKQSEFFREVYHNPQRSTLNFEV